MHAKESDLPRHTRPSVLAADQPLIVPMLLRISDLKLRGIVVLVVSKTKGITLVFKNDPLESIIVSSTFDSVASVRNFLQKEIENQLRNLFQEDLPVMIHNLSLRHIQSQQEKQRKEEWLKQQQEKKLKKKRQQQANSSGARSVFSDPGQSSSKNRNRPSSLSLSSQLGPGSVINNSNGMDTFSMPDLSTSSPINSSRQNTFFDSISQGQLSPLLPPAYSSFSDLYFIDNFNSERQRQGVPVTAANLSTLNALYSSRFAALKTPPYSEFDSSSHNSAGSKQLGKEKEQISSYQGEETNYDDFDDEEDDYEEEGDCLSFVNDASSANSMIAQEMYADNVDAPWYVTEGPELPSLHNGNSEKTLTMMAMDEDIILNPKENSIAAKLAQLTSINHTISPFAHTIEHHTFRSLPHTVKVESTRSKSKKKPKRRIIRWNTSPSSISQQQADSPTSTN